MSANRVAIVEILRPAEQGLSTPYLCRGEDGVLYFVKGMNAGRESQWKEWLCGHLAQAFGLPVPPFAIVDIDPLLIKASPPELRPVGSGPLFGSRKHPYAQWLELSLVKDIPLSLRKDVLIFDYWVGNGDRTSGNPNLLWDPPTKELVVIDHNQAFATDRSGSELVENHVFSTDWQAVAGDLLERESYRQRLSQALEVWAVACHNAPPEWAWLNEEQDIPTRFDPSVARRVLERCRTDELWRAS